MSDVIERIEKGELLLQIREFTGKKLPGTVFSEKQQDHDEILHLAKIGQQMQKDIDKCNQRVISCFVRTCPGRIFCFKYKAKTDDRLPEPPKEAE